MTCLPTAPLQKNCESSHDRLPHDDCEQRKLQCSQDDAESDACSKSDCILDESGRFVELMIGGDCLEALSRQVCCRGKLRAPKGSDFPWLECKALDTAGGDWWAFLGAPIPPPPIAGRQHGGMVCAPGESGAAGCLPRGDRDRSVLLRKLRSSSYLPRASAHHCSRRCHAAAGLHKPRPESFSPAEPGP